MPSISFTSPRRVFTELEHPGGRKEEVVSSGF